MPQIGKRKMQNVNVYNIQAHIALTREKETTSDSDTRKWSCCSAAAMARNNKKSGKISRFITELIYTVRENEADTCKTWNNRYIITIEIEHEKRAIL